MFRRAICPNAFFENFEIVRVKEGNFKIFKNHEGDLLKIARTKHATTS